MPDFKASPTCLTPIVAVFVGVLAETAVLAELVVVLADVETPFTFGLLMLVLVGVVVCVLLVKNRK